MATEGSRFFDPLGSTMDVVRVDDLVITIVVQLAGPEPFRLYEADRPRLRALLRPLEA